MPLPERERPLHCCLLGVSGAKKTVVCHDQGHKSLRCVRGPRSREAAGVCWGYRYRVALGWYLKCMTGPGTVEAKDEY